MRSELNTDDILPMAEYERIRPRRLPSILALKRRRRVLLGAHVSLLFESRDTVLHHIHELLRVEGATERRAARELADNAALVPRSGELTATVMIHSGDVAAGEALGRDLAREPARVLNLHVAGREIGAEPIPPTDEAACPIHYVRFPLRGRDLDPARGANTASLELRYGGAYIRAQLSDLTLAELRHTLRSPSPAHGRRARGDADRSAAALEAL